MSSVPELVLHFAEIKGSSPSGTANDLFLDPPWEAINPLGGIHKQVSVTLNINLTITQDPPPPSSLITTPSLEHYTDYHNHTEGKYFLTTIFISNIKTGNNPAIKVGHGTRILNVVSAACTVQVHMHMLGEHFS